MSSEILRKAIPVVTSGVLAFEAGGALNQPQKASAFHQENSFIGRSILDPRLGLVPEAQIQPIMLQEAASRLSLEINGIPHTLETLQGVSGVGINEGKVRYTTTILLRNVRDGTEKISQPNVTLHNPADYGYPQDEMIRTLSTEHVIVDADKDRIYFLTNIRRYDRRDHFEHSAVYMSLSRFDDPSAQRRFDLNSLTAEGDGQNIVYFRLMQQDSNSSSFAVRLRRDSFPGTQFNDSQMRRDSNGDPIPPWVRAAAILPSPTPEPLMTIGGKDFRIKTTSLPGNIELDWTSGNRETLDLLVRFGTGDTLIFPPIPVTAANSSMNYVDTNPRQGLNCYGLIPMRGEQPLGIGNVYCAVPFVRSSRGAPQEFAMRFTGLNTAEVSWQRGGLEVAAYVVVPLGRTPIIVSPSESRASITVNGVQGAIVLAVDSTGRVLWNTDMLFGISGVSTLERQSAQSTPARR